MASLGRSANVSNMEAKRAGRRLSGKTVPAATRAAQSVCVCIEHPLLGIKVCCQRLLSYYLLSASWAVPTSSQKLWVMLSSGRGGVSHRAVRAPQPHTCLCGPAVVLHPARRAVCLDLPLEGAGFVLRFTGRRMVPSRPVELHPRGQLFLTPVFQHFSGLEIDLHRCGLSCARSAPLRFSKLQQSSSKGFF